MKTGIAAVAVFFSSLCIASEKLELEYKQFYSHTRKLEGDDTQALQFAFGFLNNQSGKLCNIESAVIVTPKQSLPMTISAEQRFTLPSEKALKLADAKIVIGFTEAAGRCDMSVQLETKPEFLKSDYSADELSMLVEQYEAFFNEMGSFLSFMMPSVQGLSMQFDNPYLQAPLKGAPSITSGLLRLPKEWLNQNKALKLPQPPVRITAIASTQ